MTFVNGKLLGIILAILVAVCAKSGVILAGNFSPQLGQIVSPAIVAIIIGVVIHNVVGLPKIFTQGVQFSAKYILMLAIALLGATLDFGVIAKLLQAQPGIIGLIIFNICLSFSIAYGVGRMAGIDFPLCTFIGGGCSICGGTTVSTLGPIIRASESHIAFGISIIFFLDMFTIVLYPLLANALQMGPEAFGILAGTAINDTSSVLAAGDSYSRIIHNDAAYETASIVKLTRTSFLVVVAVIFSVFSMIKQCKSDSGSNSSSGTGNLERTINLLLKTFPWFILAFLVMSLLSSAGFFNNSVLDKLALVFHYGANGSTAAMVLLFKDLSRFLIIVALAGVGLKCNIKSLLAPGPRPILLGALTAFAVFLSSLTAVRVWLNL